MSPCTVSTPPVIEAGRVVFTMVHEATGRVFRCAMAGPASVEVTPLPSDATTWPEGETRAEVAEAALDYERENLELFRELFAELRNPSPEA